MILENPYEGQKRQRVSVQLGYDDVMLLRSRVPLHGVQDNVLAILFEKFVRTIETKGLHDRFEIVEFLHTCELRPAARGDADSATVAPGAEEVPHHD